MDCHSCNGCIAAYLGSSSEDSIGDSYETCETSCSDGRDAGCKHFLLCSYCCRGAAGAAGPCSKSCWLMFSYDRVQVCTSTGHQPLRPAAPPFLKSYVCLEMELMFVLEGRGLGKTFGLVNYNIHFNSMNHSLVLQSRVRIRND